MISSCAGLVPGKNQGHRCPSRVAVADNSLDHDSHHERPPLLVWAERFSVSPQHGPLHSEGVATAGM